MWFKQIKIRSARKIVSVVNRNTEGDVPKCVGVPVSCRQLETGKKVVIGLLKARYTEVPVAVAVAPGELAA